MTFSEALRRAAAQYGAEISQAQIAAFARYNDVLLEWNEKMNLTAIVEPEQVAVKHMIDSLSCWDPDVFHSGARLVDVGTGAGFPGLPLKIWRGDLDVTLLDSLNKRVRFLDAVIEALALEGIRSVHARAEDAARQSIYREQFDIAVSRAVARLHVLAEYCLPYVKLGGTFIALKGAQFQEETDEAARAIALLGGRIEAIRPICLPGIDDKRAVIYIKKIALTPKSYPRKSGTPEKNPL